MAVLGIYTSPYPIEKVGNSLYPINAEISRQYEDEFGQYPQKQVYLLSLILNNLDTLLENSIQLQLPFYPLPPHCFNLPKFC